jgi:nucleotide-binding universal stress UspA family protein
MNRQSIHSILVASDLSEGSDEGLRAGAAIAAGAGADLHVVHCIDRPVFPYWEGVIEPATQERWIRNAGLDLEWQVRRVVGEERAPASLHVALGEPSREIAERAGVVRADLVVLGPHRPRAAFDDLLGTTSDRVIRTAAVPCLLANRRVSHPLRRVLFPTDFSAPASRAVRLGADWLAALGAGSAAQAATIVEVLYVSAFASPTGRVGAIEPRLAEEAEAVRQRIPENAAIRVFPRILSAPAPVDGILRAAEQEDTDLIVLGTHGYGTLARALLGSVASAVARAVPFPILLVPPPD